MKNFWISIRITLAMCLLLGVGYVLVLRGVSAVAGPGGGQAETLTFDGRTVGAANVGQQFTDTRYFWGRPSAVDYNGGGSGGSSRPRPARNIWPKWSGACRISLRRIPISPVRKCPPKW